jgi:hypothetical protein
MQYVHIHHGDAIEVGSVRRLKTVEKAVVVFQSADVLTVYVI